MPEDQTDKVSPLFAAYEPVLSSHLPAPTDLVIAVAAEEDAKGIARLIQQREGLSPTESMAGARRGIALPTTTDAVMVARVAREVVGFGRVRFVVAPTPTEDESASHPTGWYLMGVIVDPVMRRRGIGAALTSERLKWVKQRAGEAFYFASSLNLASIDLHRRFGFTEVRRGFQFPGAHFSGGGTGILFWVDLQTHVGQ